MIKVIHTHLETQETQSSQFNNELEWLAHLTKNLKHFADFSHQVINISAEIQTVDEDKIRDAEIAACHLAIKRIGTMNKAKAPNIVIQILTNASMTQAALSLLLGGPKTARDLILSIPTELYSVEEKQVIADILNTVIVE